MTKCIESKSVTDGKIAQPGSSDNKKKSVAVPSGYCRKTVTREL